MNYIDDFIGAEKWSKVWNSYISLGKLLREIGAEEAPEKSSESDTIAECLGTLFNTLSMTISVLPDQMLELRILLESLTCKQKETRKELES